MKLNQTKQEIKRSVLKSLKLNNIDELNSEKKYNTDTEDDDDDASLDSDQELQLAFARKQLTPGLNVAIENKRKYVNDEEGLKRKLKDFYLNMEWIERMDVTVSKDQLVIKGLENKQGEELSKELIDNDFKREGLFLKQAEAAVSRSLPILQKHGVATRRAEDYFAQMAKSDEHMKRVRETLLSKHAEMEKREKVRKLREMKKMGKQIQVEVEKKKLQAKKKMNESLKKFKKSGDKDDLDIALEDDDDKSKMIKNKSKDRDERGDRKKRRNEDDDNDSKKKKINKKADYKEKKYGFGGRKKRSKYNTAESYNEGFDSKKDKFRGKGGAPNKFSKGRNNSSGGANKFAKTKFTNKNKPNKGGQRGGKPKRKF